MIDNNRHMARIQQDSSCFGGTEMEGTGKYTLDRHGWRIITICCICKKFISSVVDETIKRDKISHGLCESCCEKNYPK